MSHQQLSLGGFDPPAPTDRLFFAVFPDAEAAGRIAALAQGLREAHGLRGKPLGVQRLHVTLHHLGDYAGLPRDVVVLAEAAAADVSLPAFGVAFDSVSSFSGRTRKRPCVLRGSRDALAPLGALQVALGQAMAGAGLLQWVERDFTPHVTLLYDDRRLDPLPVDRIAWTVREFALVHSLLGRTKHRVLGRWSLAD